MTERSRRSRCKRTLLHHWWKPILGLAAYALTITILPSLVNTRGLRQIICGQAAYVLGTDVEIEEVEVELKYFGGWRLRLRGIQVANPSPDFGIEAGQELLRARKMVFEGSVGDLLKGRWQPRILIKGWHLRAYRSLGDGSLNLAHLFQ
ncbi:MAG: hypothetical protein ACYTGH_03205, partial [Planctomycetota bacterium]